MRLPFALKGKANKQHSNAAGRSQHSQHPTDFVVEPSKRSTAGLSPLRTHEKVPVKPEPKSELHKDIETRASRKQQIGELPPLQVLSQRWFAKLPCGFLPYCRFDSKGDAAEQRIAQITRQRRDLSQVCLLISTYSFVRCR